MPLWRAGLTAGCLLATLLLVPPATSAGRVGSALQQRRGLYTCPVAPLPTLEPKVTRAPVVDLAWVGTDDQVVFAISKKALVDAGGLWRSKNAGASWEEMTGHLNESIDYKENVNIIGVYSQRSAPENVMLLGGGTYAWAGVDDMSVEDSAWHGVSRLSHDFGETVKPYQTPTQWRGASIRSLKDPFNTFSWVNLTQRAKGKIAGFVDFDWAANLCPTNDCTDIKVPPDTEIYATMYANAADYDQTWDPDVSFVVSNDNFATFKTTVKCGNMFELVGHHVYLAFANSCPTDINGKPAKTQSAFPKGITLYTSISEGSGFELACLPVAINQEGYELMETHDGKGAVVIVDFKVTVPSSPAPIMIPASSVYTAGPHHALFSLSLTDVYHADFGYATDFARIEGVPGIYIANQMLSRPISPGYVDDYDSQFTSSPLVETRITFNAGGQWARIPAPETYNHGQCQRCVSSANCYLHLHGMSSWDSLTSSLPAVYSNPSAPGMIMATGNVAPEGQGLDDNDGLCTWLSIDGGVTWADVAAGPYIYEFMDWGGIIAMAKHPGNNNAPADEILFTVDYGRCWYSVPLSKALLVDNIRIEPDGQRPYVVVHGRACSKSLHPKCSYESSEILKEGLLYTLNPAALIGSQMQACMATDYETWTVPTISREPRCVLGKQMAFTRRKQDNVCLNGGAYKRPVPVNTTCPCTLDDVECDYGYIKNGKQCSKITQSRMPVCPMVDDGKYSVSRTGLRIVHGDTCSNISAVISDTNGAGSGSGSGGSSGGSGKKAGYSGLFKFLMFLLVSVVLLGAFVAWWVYLASEAQRDTIRDVAANLAYFAGSLWSWLVEKVSSLRGRGSGHAAEQDLGYFQPLGDVNGHDGGDDRGIFTLK